MVTMAQRIELLRNETGMSRPAISLAMGLPKLAFERFETGRQTPTKEQQEKIATFFGVSLFYLRGESGDRTRQDDWMNGGMERPEPVAPTPKKPQPPQQPQSTMLEALFTGKQAQEQLRQIMLDVLKSPEGQEILAKAIKNEVSGKG